MALEPQPHAGALAGAAAGPAGRAVETPYAAAAALSNAPGIGAGNPQAIALRSHGGKSQAAAIGGGPAKRPRRMGLCSEVADDGGNLEDHPALASRYVSRKGPFQRTHRPANSPQAALNLFHSGSDTILAWDIASLGE
jgi:hypothetical protein